MLPPRDICLIIADFLGEEAVIFGDAFWPEDPELAGAIADIAIDHHLARLEFEVEYFAELPCLEISFFDICIRCVLSLYQAQIVVISVCRH